MIIAICSFLGIYGNLCLTIIKEITKITDTKPLSYPFALLLYASALFLDSFFKLEILQDIVFKVLFFIVLSLELLILIFANIKKYIANN